MSKPRLTILAAILTVAFCSSLTGCADMSTRSATTPSPQQSEEPSTESGQNPADWPRVEESGVGPTTITVPNPSPDAAYLMAQFQWSSGEGSVELVEDPTIFMSGSEGGSGGYQMTLPTESKEYTFKIDVAADTTFSFSGTFITGK